MAATPRQAYNHHMERDSGRYDDEPSDGALPSAVDGSLDGLTRSKLDGFLREELEDEERRALYLQGIRLFNECDFFEAHEVWEALWTEYRGPSRKYFQGLIQAAVALHHFGNGNLRGAVKVYGTSRGYLETYRPVHLGLDVDAFLVGFDRCFQSVVASQAGLGLASASAPLRGETLDPELIPEIHLTLGESPRER